jgi:CheY-like chemotaxis protein
MILFIDDEKMFNESYVEALKEEGYDVLFEQNLTRGLEIFSKRMSEIELVIMDIMFAMTTSLPLGIDKSKIQGGLRTGVEAIRLMNLTPDGKKVPKIILTNVADEEFHRKYSTSDEVKGCYRKRDTLSPELVEIVKRILKK